MNAAECRAGVLRSLNEEKDASMAMGRIIGYLLAALEDLDERLQRMEQAR